MTDPTATYTRWQPPVIEKHSSAVKLPTAEDIERIQQSAHEEGYQSGYQSGQVEGYQQGLQQAKDEAERLALIADTLQTSLTTLSAELAQEVLTLSLDIAKQLMIQSLKVKPELLLPIVQAAIDALPQNVQHPSIHLNPDDAVIVKAMLVEHGHTGWKVVEDARISRGGCRLETASSEVDATLQGRWQRIASALGQDGVWLDGGGER